MEKLILLRISFCLSFIFRIVLLEEESFFLENVRREVRSFGDMNVKKLVEKKRIKLDVKRKDFYFLFLLLYLIKLVLEFLNDNGLEN